MGNRIYNAMIFLEEYGKKNIFPLSEKRIAEDGGHIDFTVIVVIEPKEMRDEKLCICALKVADDKSEVQGAILKEIAVNDIENALESVSEEREVPRPDICNFLGRHTYKLNFTESKLFGKGNYVLALLECKAEDLVKNPMNIVKEKQISAVCFVVE